MQLKRLHSKAHLKIDGIMTLEIKSNLSTTVPQAEIKAFQAHLWDFFSTHRRAFAWRYIDDPYGVVVSEVMLQQTQTHRVAGKYEHFLATFPNFAALASASVGEVLACWQGLGYNRRALYLQKIAQIVVERYAGQLPDDPAVLQEFPGLGPATAASIVVFAFNKPLVFIETNIRAVFIHSFFCDATVPISDKQIMPLIAATLEDCAPRDWYYALMDYGVMLKKEHKNPNRKSTHYVKQSKFEGSDRQVRGAIIRYLVVHGRGTIQELISLLAIDQARLAPIVDQLCAEGFLCKQEDDLRLY